MDFLKKLGIEDENPGAYFGNGEWSTTTDAGQIESVNPATGEVIARINSASQDDYERVIERAREIFKEWRRIPAPQRGEAMRHVGDIVREHKSELGSLISLEVGKIKPEGDGEVQEMIDICDFALGQSRMLYGKTMHSERPAHRMYEQWHPLGVVGTITAFNFPCAVWSWNACISAVCGNVTVWKPSPKASLIALALQKLVNKALEDNGYPPAFLSFMTHDNTMAERFVDDTRVDLLSFTGSCEVGRKVAARVADRYGKSLLEMGGNNAIIVDETADLELAVPAIVFGSVGTAGQRCTTTRRLIVHESLIEDLTKRLANAYKQVRIGDPLDSNTLMGPLIEQAAVDSYLKAIDTVRDAGGEIIYGGKALQDRDGYFVEPAIVRAKPEWEIVKTETFAPILYVMPYRTLDEAIEIQNSVPQGLSAALFTTNLRNAEQYLSHEGADCGIVNVNIGTSGAEIGGAFGGEKATGGGREAGSDCWKAYMRRQTNTINWSREMPLAQGIKFDI